jgi:hypothetical protein
LNHLFYKKIKPITQILRGKAWVVLCCLFCAVATAQKNAYTLEINNLDIVKKDKKTIELVFDINNIGDEDIELPYQTPLSEIAVYFDENQKTKQLVAYHYLIIEKLGKSNLRLPSGAVKSVYKMKFPLQKREIYREKKVEKTTQLIDTVKVSDLKDSMQVFTQDTFLLSTTDSVLFLKIDTIQPIKIAVDSVRKDTSPIVIPTRNCANFQIDSVWIIKQKTKTATIGFSIQNTGNQAVKLWGETPEAEDNLAIKTFLCSFDHYTKSAFFLRGLYIQDEANAIGGILEPMQRITAQMEVNLKNKTKFTPYILLEINALHNIEECETNDNFKAIRLN